MKILLTFARRVKSDILFSFQLYPVLFMYNPEPVCHRKTTTRELTTAPHPRSMQNALVSLPRISRIVSAVCIVRVFLVITTLFSKRNKIKIFIVVLVAAASAAAVATCDEEKVIITLRAKLWLNVKSFSYSDTCGAGKGNSTKNQNNTQRACCCLVVVLLLLSCCCRCFSCCCCCCFVMVCTVTHKTGINDQ